MENMENQARLQRESTANSSHFFKTSQTPAFWFRENERYGQTPVIQDISDCFLWKFEAFFLAITGGGSLYLWS